MKCEIGDSEILSIEKESKCPKKNKSQEKEKKCKCWKKYVWKFSFSVSSGKCEDQNFGCPKKNQSGF